MPRGRPAAPLSEAERLERRREKVRENVRAFRARQREARAKVAASDKDAVDRMAPSTTSQNPSPADFWLSNTFNEPRPPVVAVGTCPTNYVASALDLFPKGQTGMVSEAVRNHPLDCRLQSCGTGLRDSLLTSLRTAVERYMDSRAPTDANSLPMLIFACAGLDMLLTKSWKMVPQHLKGIGSLFEQLGPSRVKNHGFENIEGNFRAIELSFALMERRESFMSQPEWMFFHGTDSLLSSDIMQSLLDIAYQLPEEIHGFDNASFHSSCELRVQLRRLQHIRQQLQSWVLEHFCWLLCRQAQHHDVSEPFSSRVLTFDNEDDAAAFITCAGIRLHLLGLMRSITHVLPKDTPELQATTRDVTKSSLATAFEVCQAMNYLYFPNGSLLERFTCLFPFDAAWSTFSDLLKAGEPGATEGYWWCKNAASWIEASGLPVYCGR